MMLQKQSLKAFGHGYVDERFRRQNTRPFIPSTTKFSPPSALPEIKGGQSVVEQYIWQHSRERWDSCGLRGKMGNPLDRCSHLSLTFLLKTEGSPFSQPGLFPESLKEDFLSLIAAICTDNSSAEIYQHRGTWLRLSGSRIEYCRCDSGRSHCHTVPVRGMYEKEKEMVRLCPSNHPKEEQSGPQLLHRKFVWEQKRIEMKTKTKKGCKNINKNMERL